VRRHSLTYSRCSRVGSFDRDPMLFIAFTQHRMCLIAWYMWQTFEERLAVLLLEIPRYPLTLVKSYFLDAGRRWRGVVVVSRRPMHRRRCPIFCANYFLVRYECFWNMIVQGVWENPVGNVCRCLIILQRYGFSCSCPLSLLSINKGQSSSRVAPPKRLQGCPSNPRTLLPRSRLRHATATTDSSGSGIAHPAEDGGLERRSKAVLHEWRWGAS
jgi:hypothetical protein